MHPNKNNPAMKTKVLIVDDHPVTRAGVRSILEMNNLIEITGEAGNGNEAIKMVSEHHPDIIVMDITMPQLSGIEATREILLIHPNVKIIALSIHFGKNFVQEMLDAGAAGYLLKDEAPEELLKGIEKVNKGDMFLSSAVTKAALMKPEKPSKLTNIKALESKMNRPPILPDYVVRTKIIHELESNVSKPLSLISAGIGYGKSIAVSQWLEQTRYLKTWISLDNEHNDLQIFLSYLVVAIEKIFPGMLKNTSEAISGITLPPALDISKTLINELCDIDQGFIVVLDGYHKISDRNIHNLIDEWLRFPPACVHLCIITRRDPPLKIKSLQITGRMVEIRMEAMSFSTAEIADLFNQTHHLDVKTEDIKLLYIKTEGWIIALRLVLLVIRNQEDIKHVLNSIGVGLHSISDFLLNEVLAKQPQHIQELLIETALLDRFCESLINEITNQNLKDQTQSDDGNHLVQWLTKFNLFIISLDTDQKWFRYHHLFQEFLLDQLKKWRNEQQINEIHIKASSWYESNHFIAEAIDHAQKAHDSDRIKRIIAENWENYFYKDEWNEINGWLSHLPKTESNQPTNLLLARIWNEIRKHRISRLPYLIKQIEKKESPLTQTEKGHLTFAKGMVAYFKGHPKKAKDYAEKAMKLIPGTYYKFRTDIAGWYTGILTSMGNGTRAIKISNEALNCIDPPGEPIQTSYRTMHPNFVYITNADLPSLKKRLDQFFRIPEIGPYMLGFGWYFKSVVQWWSYNHELAIQFIEKTLKYRKHTAARQGVDCYICLSIAYQEMNRPEEALIAIDKGIQFALELDTHISYSIALAGKARLNLLLGNQLEAEEWLNDTKATSLDISMFWWVEVPAITRCRVMVNRGTIEDLNEALELLREYREFSESIFNKMRTIDILVLQALAYKKLGQQQEALNTLRTSIELAANGDWIRPFAEQSDELMDLLLLLKEEGLKLTFIDKILESVEKKKNLLLKAFKSEVTIKTTKDKLNTFTPGELKVLQCIMEGLRNKEIAEKLFNSEETIKKHISHMFQKLNVKNRLSLVSKAKVEGLIQ